MLRLQGSSARYYQRPDADHVELDPDAHASCPATPPGCGWGASRAPGAGRWPARRARRASRSTTPAPWRPPTTSAGFAQLSYGTPFSGGPWQRVDASLSLSSGWNFGGTRQYATPERSRSIAVWRNFWRSYVRVAHDLASL
jgi:hypothetical protein